MTEARKRAAELAAQIEAMVGKLPEGTSTTIRSGWRSHVVGMIPVDIRIHISRYGQLVDYIIDGRNKSSRHIETECKSYDSLNWSEADCIHLCKAGRNIIDGIDKLACEMMID